MPEPAVAAVTTWLPAAAGCVFGCSAGTAAGADVLTVMGSDGLLADPGPDFGRGASVIIAGLTVAGPDESLSEAVFGFGCEGGMTTADGWLLLAAGLCGNEEPGGVVPPLDWDRPGAIALVLDAVEAVAFPVGASPVPGDPSLGNAVPS